MTRNLKVLGVALAAVLAMSAFASAASAAEFRSPVEHTTLHSDQINENVFGSTAGSVTCEKTTTHSTTLKTAVSFVETSELKFTNCHIIILGSTVKAEIFTNGCNYKLYSSGNADIVCPAGASIEVKASGCTVKVGGQTGLKGITYTNNGNHIDMNANITTGIKYSHSGFLCGTGEGTNGSYTGKNTIEGRDTTGTLVNLDYS